MDGMSAEEMRNALYERLHNKGLLDLLKVKCVIELIVVDGSQRLPSQKFIRL